MLINYETALVTDHEERRINGDTYILTKPGHHFLALGEEVPVRSASEKRTYGSVIIKSLLWDENQTTITYELVKLKTVN